MLHYAFIASINFLYCGKIEFLFPNVVVFPIYIFKLIYALIELIQQLKNETSTCFSSLVAGQIRQWNLVFHGTEDPPQKTDPPRQGKKKTVNNIVQNSLENSQWGFIAQDVSYI